MGNLTVKESGEIVNIISPNVNNITSFKVHFNPKQEGTGDPSPENVREIVSWNGVEGYKCGKNLFDYAHANILDRHIKNDNGVSVSDGGNSYCQIYIPVMPNTTYTLSGLSNEKLFAKRIYYYDKDKQWISRTNGSTKTSFTITTPSNCRYIQIQYERQEYQDWSIVQVELGDTATEFEPYKYGTVLMDWTDTIGNIYGGYVDLITGEIYKNYEQVIFDGTIRWSGITNYDNTNRFIYIKESLPLLPQNNAICYFNYLTNGSGGQIGNGFIGSTGNVLIYTDKNINSIDSLMEYQTNNPLQLIYELKTPVYVTTLSPTQLSTLKGQNNFWSNADYVEIEYELTETFDIQKAKRKIILNQPHVESASGTIAKPETDMIGKIKECKIHFMPVQQGDGDPTPDNIVPVTGWTGIDMYSTGKNLFNLNVPVGLPSSTNSSPSTNRIFTPYTVIKGTSGTNYYSPGAVNSYSINDDILTVNSRSGYGVGFAIKIKPNQTYTISGSADSEYGAVAISTYSRDGKFTKIREVSRFINYPYYSFNTNSQADMLVLTFYAPSGGYNIDIHYSNIQLETGNTVTNYEPFKGNAISVNWENEVGTMYGGYVDLISGELIQEFKQCKINELSWTYIASGACFVTSKNTPNDILKDRSLLISYIRSDYYTPINGYGDIATYSNFQDYSISLYAPSDQYRIAIKDSRFTDVSSFLSAMGDTYIWYRLAEPTVTYQLTPQQLTTLRGINNIWSSANGEVEIKYWKH